MRSIIDDINECGREYRPSPTRLGIYRDKPARRRTWRSVAAECVSVPLLVIAISCACLLVVHICIGAMLGFWNGVNELCRLAMMVVGR